MSELLEGETLRERVNAGPVAVRKAIQYALAIAHGLTAAHEKGITHRDLKPENVFVTGDNRIKILDFGLAKLTQDPVRGREFDRHGAVADAAGGRARHRRLHGAGTGARTAGGSPRRSVCAWRDPLRAAVGAPRIFPRHGAGDDDGDPQRGSGRISVRLQVQSRPTS